LEKIPRPGQPASPEKRKKKKTFTQGIPRIPCSRCFDGRKMVSSTAQSKARHAGLVLPEGERGRKKGAGVSEATEVLTDGPRRIPRRGEGHQLALLRRKKGPAQQSFAKGVKKLAPD